MKRRFALLAMGFTLLIPLIVSGAQKTITSYTGDRIINVTPQAPSGSISFDQDIADFGLNNPSTAGAVTLDTTNKAAYLGGGSSVSNSCGVLWYGGTKNTVAACENGKCDFSTGFRAYFKFMFVADDGITPATDTHSSSGTLGQGFTFTVMNGYNNDRTRRGGPPSGTGGSLLCYAGPDQTPDENGLQYPKFAIEFDTYPNNGGNTNGCQQGRNDYTSDMNHISLMFWGNHTTGSCGTYNRISYDDNYHGNGSGLTSPTNPDNSEYGVAGYCQRLNGKVGLYNWMEDTILHEVRIEVTRATESNQLGCSGGRYAYNIKAWVDCEGACCSGSSCSSCPVSENTAFHDVYNSYANLTYPPKINRTICLDPSYHSQPYGPSFDEILFGFTEGTGPATQNILIKNFVIYFTTCTNGNPPGEEWTWCADENGTCSFSGTKTVAYGRNCTFAQQTATNSISCNNATFGDPLVGTLKKCFYK